VNRSSLFRLTRLNLRRERRAALFSAFGVAIGVGALVFFIALGLGVGRLIREKVFPVDATLIEVVPPAVSVGGWLAGGTLDEAAISRIEALPGVAQVYRKMNVRVPAASRYDGDFFGSHIRMGVEVLAVGVEPGLVKADVLLGDFTDPGAGKPIPGVAATRLLEIYNKSFAPSRKLPQLSGQLLAGFSFPVDFNRSFINPASSGPVIPSQVQLVGLSDRAPLAGLAIPLDAARRLNRQAGADANTFTALTVRARDASQVPTVADAVRQMGFSIDDSDQRLNENAGLAVTLVTAALSLLSGLICALAAINIAHALFAQVRARTREIGVMRAVGATRSDVARLLLSEASAIGLLGGALGVLGARLSGLFFDAIAGRFLPSFPFKPDSFFAFPAAVWIGGALLGLFAALAGAWAPSRLAAATDPARTLAG
jgi:putative ABC transport system permease protein